MDQARKTSSYLTFFRPPVKGPRSERHERQRLSGSAVSLSWGIEATGNACAVLQKKNQTLSSLPKELKSIENNFEPDMVKQQLHHLYCLDELCHAMSRISASAPASEVLNLASPQQDASFAWKLWHYGLDAWPTSWLHN